MTSPQRIRTARPVAPAPRRPRPDLRVVPPRTAPKRTGLIFAASTIAVFACLMASAVLHSMLVSGQDHLDANQRQAEATLAEIQRSRLSLAEAQSPERIAREAAALGMPKAAETHWHGSKGGDPVVVTGAAGTASGASEEQAGTGATEGESPSPTTVPEATDRDLTTAEGAR